MTVRRSSPVDGSAAVTVSVPSSRWTREKERSTTSTQPAVPRTPVTMVDVRMFRLSSSFTGAVTLKNSLPDTAFSSSFFPDLDTSPRLDASSFTALVLSRLT